jgi:cysteinyl-tRNA synthetase
MSPLPLRFYNTLSRQKDDFAPIDPEHIKLYVCGPTVYDRIHIGNARPIVVFDVLVRLLRHCFPKVTYVRNITDVDDKINARAAEENRSIRDLTDETVARFHEDCQALGALAPDAEPRATDHIDGMIAMITTLIDRNHAYVAEGHVLFDVASYDGYGALSRRSIDELKAGARVDVAPYKKSPMDFVLWKPSDADLPGWDSPWGRGRPGWHIECSAMSRAYLGEVFDIHGGGLDLIFPHHENEISQSCAAHGTDQMARYWIHNGYVTVDGEKMSKSLGNFVTMADLLKSTRGEVIRHALLQGHYRGPLDFSVEALKESEAALSGLYRAVGDDDLDTDIAPDADFMAALADDLNTPLALARLHHLAGAANRGEAGAKESLKASAVMLGLLEGSSKTWFQGPTSSDAVDGLDDAAIQDRIQRRNEARAQRDFAAADAIRDELAALGITLEDKAEGTVWRRG